jgi:hypothetical protein
MSFVVRNSTVMLGGKKEAPRRSTLAASVIDRNAVPFRFRPSPLTASSNCAIRCIDPKTSSQRSTLSYPRHSEAATRTPCKEISRKTKPCGGHMSEAPFISLLTERNLSQQSEHIMVMFYTYSVSTMNRLRYIIIIITRWGKGT